jgi:hypothetical protein
MVMFCRGPEPGCRNAKLADVQALFDRPERMPEIELIDHGIVIAG